MTENVAVFFDYQNVHLTGHGLFGGGCEPYRCVPDPVRLADLIASRRSRPSSATAIRVYRGRPDPNHQRVPTAANDAQASEWSRDRRVQVIRRQLNYRDWPKQSPVEKGIDVALAVDLIHLAFGRQYVEVACWAGFKPLRFPSSKLPWCHSMSQQDWESVTDDWQGRV